MIWGNDMGIPVKLQVFEGPLAVSYTHLTLPTKLEV